MMYSKGIRNLPFGEIGHTTSEKSNKYLNKYKFNEIC